MEIATGIGDGASYFRGLSAQDYLNRAKVLNLGAEDRVGLVVNTPGLESASVQAFVYSVEGLRKVGASFGGGL